MAVTRGAMDRVVTPGFYKVYTDEYEQLPSTYDQVLKVDSTGQAYLDVAVNAGLGTTPVKPESVDTAMDRPLQVGTVRMTVVSYGLGFELSQEIQDDDLYNVVGKPASQMLAQSGRDTEERQAWALLNGSFTTTKSYDAVSVVNTAHALAGGSTYGNAPAAAQAFSFTALQASLERQMLMVNERGFRVRQVPNKVIVPVQLSWIADEILGSSGKPYTSDNTPNVLASGKIGLTPFSSPFLTSTTAWWTLSPNHKLMFFWRQRPLFDSEYIKRSRIQAYYSYFRFGTAAFDWRGVDGSTG